MLACVISVESNSPVSSKNRIIFVVKTSLKILLVGNCIQDHVFTLPRFPPEDDEMRAQHRSLVLGGNACNSAQVLQQLGHEVHLMCSLAQDAAADWIRQQLVKARIAIDLCQTFTSGSTPVSSIWLNQQNGSRTIVHHRDLPELTLQHLQQINPADFDWIHFEGRNIETLSKFLPSLQASGVPMSLEIEKQRTDIQRLAPFVDTIVISSQYLKQRNISAPEAMQELKLLNPGSNLVCTLGSNGLVALKSNDELISIKTETVQQAVDTLAAGDCFIAGLISRLCQQQTFETALQFANKLAARKIQFRGLIFEEIPV